MTKKTYTVLKAVKSDGVELGTGDDIALEPGQAQGLLVTFVEEKPFSPTPKPAQQASSVAASASAKGAKAADGL